jgi:hypothetical protein
MTKIHIDKDFAGKDEFFPPIGENDVADAMEKHVHDILVDKECIKGVTGRCKVITDKEGDEFIGGEGSPMSKIDGYATTLEIKDGKKVLASGNMEARFTYYDDYDPDTGGALGKGTSNLASVKGDIDLKVSREKFIDACGGSIACFED